VADVGKDALYPVNLQTRQVGPAIPVGHEPLAVAVTPNGKWAYVVDSGFSQAQSLSGYRHSPVFKGAVIPVNLITGHVFRPIKVGLGPISIAITPNGKWAYVANMGILGGLNNTYFAVDGYTVVPINLTTNRPGKPIYIGPGPGAIAITPNGKWAYVSVTGTPEHPLDYVVPINLATKKVGSPIHTGISPMAIAITPNGKWAYVANTGWPQPALRGHTVTPINLSTNTAEQPIQAGEASLAIAITPNGKWAYVANTQYGQGRNFTITPINLTTNRPGKPIPVGPGPTSIAITPDGKWAYVADDNGAQITPIDLSMSCAGKPIKVGQSPAAVAIVSEPMSLINHLVKG
jgi:DNA-binding beta-propeller fold protein YncE